MLSAAYRPEQKDVFFEKDLNRKHFFEKYPYVELSAMKKRFGKKTTDQCKTLLLRKLLNYRLEKESGKLLITICISKIGSVETIETVLNFDQKDWPDFVD